MIPRRRATSSEVLPISDATGAFEMVVASQLLAYELALVRGCDPDRPRNLAKSVTVR